MYYMVMSVEKLEDKRTTVAARMVWKNIRNNFSLNEWFNSETIIENFRNCYSKRQIISAFKQLEKRKFIRVEQEGVLEINENYLINLIKRVHQRDHVRLANVIENYFLECSSSDDKLPNEFATLMLINEQYKNSAPMERAYYQMMLLMDNYRMETEER
jgi:hypothetical protein